MNKILFTFKNAVISLTSNKFLNCIVVLTLSAGLILPLMLISSVNYNNKTYKQSYYNYIEETVYADCLMKYTDTQIMDKLLSADFIKDAAYCVITPVSIKLNGESTIVGVTGMSESYFDVRRLELLQGRAITKEEILQNAKVCMLNASSSKNKVGDIINIAGEEFEVVGMVRNPQMYGGIMIPYNFIEALDINGKMWQYQIYVQAQSSEKLSNTRMHIRTIQGIQILTIDDATKAEANWRNEMLKPIKKEFVESMILLGFALVTFILIIYSKFLQEKYKFGVKQAMGSGQGMFFGEILIQTFLLVQIAAIIDVALAKIVVPYLSDFGLLIDSTFYITAEALCLVISVVVSLLLFALLKRKNVVQILYK